jgi:hypothetical protein
MAYDGAMHFTQVRKVIRTDCFKRMERAVCTINILAYEAPAITTTNRMDKIISPKRVECFSDGDM